MASLVWCTIYYDLFTSHLYVNMFQRISWKWVFFHEEKFHFTENRKKTFSVSSEQEEMEPMYVIRISVITIGA